jgi:GTP pyrophosphokinase
MVIEDTGLTATSVIAILLHEAIHHSTKNLPNATPEEIIKRKKIRENAVEKTYGLEVANIVRGLNKIAATDIRETSLQAENFRKLIVSYSTDPRVTIIKLIDRLEVMRSLAFFPKSKQQKKATETAYLYAPLAHQLGLYNIKSELEDLSLKYTEPEAYRLINNKLKSSAGEREKILQTIVAPVDRALQKEGLRYEIKSRTKSIFSIWKKMQAQKIDFEKIYDIFAIRIILDVPNNREQEEAACWQVYSLIEKIYDTDLSRLRDWISRPKPSGYRSLHITVKTPEGHPMEVQIRTTGMDDAAERGIAAHWKYKGIQDMGAMQTWLDNVRRLLESPGKKEIDYFKNVKLNEIIVLTPAGDLRRLPAGASVLDFAFDLHTNVGLKTVSAKVNGKMVPIKEMLHTGDVVEVATSKNQQPNGDWLNHVVTSKARSKIKQKLREEETKRAEEGKELLERRLKNWKLALTDDLLSRLLKHYRLKSVTDLYAGLANESIDITEVKEVLSAAPEEASTAKTEGAAEGDVKTATGSNYLIIDEKLNSAGYKLAKCCRPIYGDPVFGFITISDGIKIHHYSCPNAARLLEKYPYRIIEAKWRKTATDNDFLITLRITGDDDPFLLNGITDTITRLNAVLRSINLSGKKGLLEGQLQVLVRDNKHLDMLIDQLKKVKGVEKVVRIN